MRQHILTNSIYFFLSTIHENRVSSSHDTDKRGCETLVEGHWENRDWLAMECGTEKGTVNNWLSPSGPFPASAMLKIQSLMSQYKTVQPEDEPVQTNRLVLEITEERMRKYERAASEKGVPLRQWLTDLADEAAEERQLRPTHSPLVPLVRQFPSHAGHARREYSTQIIGNIAAGSLAESDTVPSTITWKGPWVKTNTWFA